MIIKRVLFMHHWLWPWCFSETVETMLKSRQSTKDCMTMKSSRI